MSKRMLSLCLIVKNESHIIRRCLSAARPVVEYALIVDTGSTDSTIGETRAALAALNLPGEVVSEPWRDFASNRSSALARLRTKNEVSYALMIDADDQLMIKPGVDASELQRSLSTDLVNVWTRLGGYSYVRPQILSNRKPFRFRGVLHEFATCDEPFNQAETTLIECLAVQDSARNAAGDKYARDAETLRAALAVETDPDLRSRYAFYLAQSHRDAGQWGEAAAAYRKRAAMGGWSEEVYVSLVCAAQMSELAGEDEAECLDLYMRAFELIPSRAEALHAAAKFCRMRERWRAGYLFAKQAAELDRPLNGLFIADWVYEYGAKDELAILAYWSGRPVETLTLCDELLKSPSLPPSDRPRVQENKQFALRLLAGC